MRKTLVFSAGLLLMASLRPLSAQEGALGSNNGPEIRFRGCMYYEHANFEGKSTSIPGGIRRRLGSAWDDEISSIACNPYCHLTVYEYRDFNGADETFGGQISFVGEAWNDDISSMVATCTQ